MTDLAVLIVGGIVVAMIAAVMCLHFAAWRRARKGMGILPLHVLVISSAQILFLLNSGQLALSAGGPALWRHGAGLVLTIAALVIIGEYQRRRLIVQTKKELRDSLH